MPKNNKNKKQGGKSKGKKPTPMSRLVGSVSSMLKPPNPVSMGRSLLADAEQHLHDYMRQSVCVAPGGTPVGVPIGPNQPSQKCKVYKYFTATADANGTVMVAFNPTLANDLRCALVTNGSTITWGTSAALPSFASADAGLDIITPNLPYANASLSPTGVQGRVVSAGLSFKYDGAPLYCQGTYFAIHNPDHLSFNGLGVNDLTKYQECQVDSVEVGKKVAVHMHPNKQADSDYTTQLAGPWGTGAGTDFPCVVVMTGQSTVAGNPGKFLFELTYVVEYIGEAVQGNTTRNPIPAMGGFDHAVAVVSKLASVRRVTKKHGPALAAIGSQILKSLRGPMGNVAIKAMETGLESLLL